jgi:hypothetical protein
MYRFKLPIRKAKFCGVPSRAIVKIGCAVRKKRLRNTALLSKMKLNTANYKRAIE